MKLRLLLGMVAGWATLLFAQAPPIEWDAQHGPGAIESGWSVIQTADGGYAVAGQTDIMDFAADYYLIRLAADGSTLWTHIYNSPDYELSYSVIQKSDGGFFLAGTRSGAVSQWYVVETDAGGTMTNSALSSTVFGDQCLGAIGTGDGGLLLCGSTVNVDSSTNDGLIVKLDAALSVQWTQSYHFTEGPAYLEDVEHNGSGGYAAAGGVWGFSAPAAVLVEVDGSGSEIWRQMYQPTSYDYANALDRTADGGYILCGIGVDGAHPSGGALLLRTTGGGAMLWSNVYSDFFGRGADVIESADQGLVVTGYDYPTGSDAQFWIFKTDMIGQIYWFHHFGDASSDFGNCIVQTSDGGYIATGTRSRADAEDQNVYTVKLLHDEDLEGPLAVELVSFDATVQSNGIELSFATASENDNDHFEIWRAKGDEFVRIANLESQGDATSEQRYRYVDRSVHAGQTYRYFLADVGVNGARTEHRDRLVTIEFAPEHVLPEAYALSAYPNPFNPSTTIEFTIVESGRAHIGVYDLSGRFVRQLVDDELASGAHKISFDAGDLPSGIYFVRLETPAASLAQKIVLMK